MTNEFYRSHGKLLLTGEYLVLKGADALVLPLRKGQSLKVYSSFQTEKNRFYWKAFQYDELWFEAIINSTDLSILKTTDPELAKKLIHIFKTIRQLHPELFENNMSFGFETSLEFDRNWGFGSSSTLIANLAEWAHIDPFLLHFKVSEGSGYDIAATKAENPFIYNFDNGNYKVSPIVFNPPFTEKLFFVYLGNKQDSIKEVDDYLGHFHPDYKLINRISQISNEIILCNYLNDFEELITLHEKLLSDHLSRETIKNLRFPDFSGTVKSLGAWGGDFVLMTCREGEEYMAGYLKNKGYGIFFKFDELVKQSLLTSNINQ